MQETGGKGNGGVEQKSCSTGGGTIFLLLFVGFVFGMIAGFATKDQIVRSYSKMINNVVKVDQEAAEPGAQVKPVKEDVAGEEKVATEPEKKADEKKDDEKKEEEKKPEDKKEEEKKPEEKKAE